MKSASTFMRPTERSSWMSRCGPRVTPTSSVHRRPLFGLLYLRRPARRCDASGRGCRGRGATSRGVAGAPACPLRGFLGCGRGLRRARRLSRARPAQDHSLANPEGVQRALWALAYQRTNAPTIHPASRGPQRLGPSQPGWGTQASPSKSTWTLGASA
jgi:hypothetical protein